MDKPALRHSDSDAPQPHKRARPVRVLAPDVVPMPTDDYEQAVTALAAMIATWWHHRRLDLDL